MLRILNWQIPQPPLHHTEFSVQKIPTHEHHLHCSSFYRFCREQFASMSTPCYTGTQKQFFRNHRRKDAAVLHLPSCERNHFMSRRPKPVIDTSVSPASLPLRPCVRLRLAKQDSFFGPGVAEFLVLVDQTSSMQTACKEMEMSYSKGWKMIKKAENYLGYSLIESRSGGAAGGSSHLTAEARDFLDRYLSMEKELKAATAQLFEKYFG